jgi:sulfide:quinone oxidoreductase
MSLPVVGATNCTQVEGYLAARGIGFSPKTKVMKVDGSTIVTDASTVRADLLIGVPPHRPPALIRESGLTLRGEWLAVDSATLRTSVEGIFAVGDVVEIPTANAMALPKAGIFAEAQARVAASQIISDILRRPAPAVFDGRGYCFIEIGGGQATMVQGDFLAAPAPAVQVAPPSAQIYQQKVAFEQTRLSTWFAP